MDDVSLSRIGETISQAEALAKSHVESLGMAGLLKAHKLWDNLPVCPDNSDSDSDSDEEDEIPNVAELNLLALETTVENASEIEDDIKTLSTSNLIDSKLEHSLSNLKQSLPKLKRVSNSSVPLYDTLDSPTGKKSKNKPIFSPFLEVKLKDDTSIFIRKTTALWLFQEGERVLSDQLFRVRAKQPYFAGSTHFEEVDTTAVSTLPLINKSVKLGEVCIFIRDGVWRIGKVLQFSWYKKKTIKSRQFKGSSVMTDIVKILVCCALGLVQYKDRIICSKYVMIVKIVMARKR